MVSRDLENSCLVQTGLEFVAVPLPHPPNCGACLVSSFTLGAKAYLHLDKDLVLCFQGVCTGEHAALGLFNKYGP